MTPDTFRAAEPAAGRDFDVDEVNARLLQRVKLVHGADGANDGDVALANPFPTRGMLWTGAAWVPAPGDAANGADVDVTRSVLPTGAARQVDVEGVRDRLPATFDGGGVRVTPQGTVAVDSELPAAAALSDALANPTAPLVGGAKLTLNATTGQWQRDYGDSGSVELLADMVRSGTTSAPTQTTPGARGVYITIALTALDPGLTLTPSIRASSDVPTNWVAHRAFSGITSTGNYVVLLYPGVAELDNGGSGTISDARSAVLPRDWLLRILASGAGNYTMRATAKLLS